MKNEIKKYITFIYKKDLTGNIDDIIEYLKELKEDHLGNYKYLKIDINNNIDENIDISLLGVRDETDKEYQKRMDFVNNNKKVTEKREKELLETLKAKYESKER